MYNKFGQFYNGGWYQSPIKVLMKQLTLQRRSDWRSIKRKPEDVDKS